MSSLVQEWNLADRVKFMSFDSTASNAGAHVEACVLVEKKRDRNIISLACRHRNIIMELIVAKVFDLI